MTHVEWKPYPKEKPKEEKQYLISFYVYKEKRSGVDIDFYNPEHDVWDVYDDGAYTRVTAWAERPEPYSGSKEVEQAEEKDCLQTFFNALKLEMANAIWNYESKDDAKKREKFLKKIRKEIELLMEPYGVGNGRPD